MLVIFEKGRLKNSFFDFSNIYISFFKMKYLEDLNYG
ncbi:hypothetical protein EDB96_0739 [Flavobacterium sp. S87F.05.LMB.W.Kidney.N]|nr:hypothetical protein EDB96_0739 [Flavobacterium sp. S87F.05.LMB.W.Kidney.N]